MSERPAAQRPVEPGWRAAGGGVVRQGALLVGAWAVLAAVLALAVPFALRVEAAALGLRFLGEFLGEGSASAPGPETAAPLPATLEGDARADLWRPPWRGPHPGLLLIHGLTPDGKDDPRVAAAAAALARGGFAVLVPDLPALRAQRLSPADAAVAGAALARLAGLPDGRRDGLVVLAVSVGTAPALQAVRTSGLGDRVRLVVALGGYAEAAELIRYFTTGAYRYGDAGGRRSIDPELTRAFLLANLDLVVHDAVARAAVRAFLEGHAPPAAAGPEAQAVLALLANRVPDRVDALLAALPRETQTLLDALSPARHARALPGRLLLVHGRHDPAVPFTESLRLAAAADPARTRVVLVDLVAHVEGAWPGGRQALGSMALWSAAYELFRQGR